MTAETAQLFTTYVPNCTYQAIATGPRPGRAESQVTISRWQHRTLDPGEPNTARMLADWPDTPLESDGWSTLAILWTGAASHEELRAFVVGWLFDHHGVAADAVDCLLVTPGGAERLGRRP